MNRIGSPMSSLYGPASISVTVAGPITTSFVSPSRRFPLLPKANSGSCNRDFADVTHALQRSLSKRVGPFSSSPHSMA